MMNVETAEKICEAISNLDALRMMADAYIIGPNDYPAEEAANAFDAVIEAARAKLAEALDEVKTELRAG